MKKRITFSDITCAVALATLTQGNTSTAGDIRRVALAIDGFQHTHKSLPAHASYDKNGKPLLSWRVHVLPYMGARKLYEQFRIDEPWNSAHNKKLIPKMPEILKSPAGKGKPGYTRYAVPVGEKMVFTGTSRGIPLRDMIDDHGLTIMLIEVPAEKAVIWTKPEDIKIDLKKPLQELDGKKSTGFHVCFVDGAKLFVPRNIKEAKFRAWLTRNGKD